MNLEYSPKSAVKISPAFSECGKDVYTIHRQRCPVDSIAVTSQIGMFLLRKVVHYQRESV